MSAAQGHAEVLNALLGLKGGAQPVCARVRLLARLADDKRLKGVDPDKALVFFPDFHLNTVEQSREYDYSFHFLDAAQTHSNRELLLDDLLDALRAARTGLKAIGKDLELYQLGDFVDLWRAHDFEFQSKNTVQGDAEAILAELFFLDSGFVTKGGGLQAKFVNGNHDRFLGELARIDCARARVLRSDATGKDHILVTHGDLFDPTERTFAEAIKRAMVRLFGPGVSPNVYSVPDGTAQLPGSQAPMEVASAADALPAAVNCGFAQVTADRPENTDDDMLKTHHELLPDAVDAFAGLAKGSELDFDMLELKRGPALTDLRLLVVGHSHHPRLVALDEEDGDPFMVFLDGGAWLENVSVNGGAPVASAQIAVVCGADVRIYQLDPTPAV